MYSGRLGMKTLLLGETVGGTILLTDRVENYPGFKTITGQELADKMKEHALDYKEFVSIKEKRVTKIDTIDNGNGGFDIYMKEEKVHASSVIFATGTKWRELKVPGHDEFKNKGVHYCALCDGFFYKDKVTGIVGGSDSAAKDALALAELAKKVYIIYRGEKIHPELPNMKRIEAADNIEIINHTNVKEINGDESGVTHIILDNEYEGSNKLELEGLFIAIGHVPLSYVAKEAGVEADEKGYIKINRKAETNIPGFFAAGDVVDTHFKQAIVGVGEGVLAAYGAYEFVKNKEIKN